MEVESRRSVAERIRTALTELSPAERRIGRTLLATYPFSGLDTVASLAGAAKVSPPTVIRFARSLGFEGYKDFQTALRCELAAKQESNLSQAEAMRRSARHETATWSKARDAYLAGIEETFAGATDKELAAIIEVLTSARRRICCFGGTYTGYIADLLVAQLAPARPGVRALSRNPLLAAGELAEMRPGDVAVAMDVRRYEPLVLERAQTAKEAGLRIVLLTDQWLSPISAFADFVLTADVRAAGPSDTLVPMLALVEGVCELVVEELGDVSLRRLAAIDPLRPRLN